ncbi:hypothetical protein CCACVL1_12539 [Corchorus capsularis]|uniref:Uncharacterized protein n=1 Tax=Corchorus capsularis TaxID=210143 RepID=A0A1R3IFE5_COCAP|nr:hypothetical protein CCACVL1_12539 [Corchorus capsularis]
MEETQIQKREFNDCSEEVDQNGFGFEENESLASRLIKTIKMSRFRFAQVWVVKLSYEEVEEKCSSPSSTTVATRRL